MSNAWIKDELETAKLDDLRLNERFEGILQAFADRPNASIPAAMGGRAELEAAYRFFDNENVSPEKILRPHHDAVDVKLWTRDEIDETRPTLTKEEKRKRRLALPIEDKESIRWTEGIIVTQKLVKACPETLCVSEGDIYELFVEPRTTDNVHWIVRAGQERAALDDTGVSTGPVRDSVLKTPVLFTNEITVRGREQLISCENRSRRTSRITRRATVEVRAETVTIKAPMACRHAVRSVTVGVVLVREVNPPEGEEPVEWVASRDGRQPSGNFVAVGVTMANRTE